MTARPTVDARPELDHVRGAVWRARWVALGAALVAGLGGYLISAQQAPEYTATSSILLSQTAEFDPLGRPDFGDPSRHLATQVDLINSVAVFQPAADSLQDVTSAQLFEAVAVVGQPDSDRIEVTADAPTAAGAVARANAVVASYRAYVSGVVAARTQAAISATTDPSGVAQIQATAAVYGDGVAVADDAQLPTSASSPNPRRDALVVAAVAALLTLVVAAARRPAPPVTERLRAAAGAPLLDVVPVPSSVTGWSEAGAADYAVAVVALEYARDSHPGPVVVTGASADGNVVAAVRGIAMAEVARGRRVLLVDADPVRRPLMTLEGVTAPAAVLGSPAVLAADRPWTPADVARVSVSVLPDSDRLWMATTSLPGDDQVVDERLTGEALALLAPQFDVVLVLVGPVAEDAAALAQLRLAGSAVLVAGVRAPVEGVRAASARVAAAGVPLLGVLITRPVRRPAKKPPVTQGRSPASSVARAAAPRDGLSPEPG